MEEKLILGMPTLIECTDIYETVRLCKELSLKFVELNMNLPQYQIDNMDVELYKKIKEEEGIFFTIHLDENINVSDFNKHISGAYVHTVLEAIKLAKDLEIPVLNMHMAAGVYFTLPDKKVYLFNEYKENYLCSLRKFRDACAAEIGNSSIKLCIENTGGYQEFMKQGIESLLESKVFALTYDVGHDHSCRHKDRDFILNNKERLVHMHIHDACGAKNHLVLGTGEIDLKGKIRTAIENKCRCVIETKTNEGLRKSVKYLTEIM